MLCHTCGGKGHFKRDCPNRKVMFINEDNEYETGDDVDPNAPDDDDYDTDGEDAYPSDARTIVVSQHALNVLPSASTQRCNLFQTKALVGPDKACKVIIDGGSCRNLASKELCTKLKLKYLPHPHPYYIRWLSDNGEMKEFSDVFPEEVPAGLPPLRGIKRRRASHEEERSMDVKMDVKLDMELDRYLMDARGRSGRHAREKKKSRPVEPGETAATPVAWPSLRPSRHALSRLSTRSAAPDGPPGPVRLARCLVRRQPGDFCGVSAAAPGWPDHEPAVRPVD
ncbi:hypothetical protein QYE76_010000 [Lolium multiflorum]|uniref:CCHC-type domain-containing protein n=1 Tax=Lolium multiflorum TaxID=4521 RepID=A0AAD8X1G6_LOLMU|nr:hypothetical protein QYE76_010000 [Lolium multiflorum]